MKKIYFIVSQIKTTQNLFNIIESNFFARVISRKIIIRIKDFIDLSRRYNNANIIDNDLKREIKRKLNELDNNFKEKLQLQRHKLSAHIQDLDLSDRIHGWQDITKDEIDKFSHDIFEIYRLFHRQETFQELIDENFELSIEQKNSIRNLVKEKDIESEPHIGMDILSITRSNTGSIIPCHPIQDKILTLNSINLMLDFEISLFNCLDNNNYKQLVKTLAINDIISFIDNLITRENSSYIGLDEIIDFQIRPWKRHRFFENKPNNFSPLKGKKYDFREDKEIRKSQRVLNIFLEKFNFESVASIRDVRNKIGSHIDKNSSIESVVILLDNLDSEKIVMIYDSFYNLFLKVCKATFYMNNLVMPTTKIHGRISAISPQPKKMFFNDLEIKTEFKSDDINTIAIYKAYIDDMLNQTRDEEDIISYFRNALEYSNIVETVEFDNKKIELTICQRYFITRLKESSIIEEKRAILFLLSKVSDWKTNKTYILLETYSSNSHIQDINYDYLVYLGDTHQEYSEKVLDILLNNLKNTNDFSVVYYTLLSLLTIDKNIWGSVLINNRENATESRYSEIIKKEISTMDSFFQLIVSLLLTSEMIFTSKFSIYRNAYQKIYLDYFQQIFSKNLKKLKFSKRFELKKRLSPKDINQLKTNYNTNHLTKIFIKLAEHSNSENSKFLYSIMVSSLKLNFKLPPFIEHYAYANYRIGDIDKAVEVYESLVQNNPDIVAYRIEILNYYFEQKNFQAIEKNIKYIESIYKLTDKELEKINHIKDRI